MSFRAMYLYVEIVAARQNGERCAAAWQLLTLAGTRTRSLNGRPMWWEQASRGVNARDGELDGAARFDCPPPAVG